MDDESLALTAMYTAGVCGLLGLTVPWLALHISAGVYSRDGDQAGRRQVRRQRVVGPEAQAPPAGKRADRPGTADRGFAPHIEFRKTSRARRWASGLCCRWCGSLSSSCGPT